MQFPEKVKNKMGNGVRRIDGRMDQLKNRVRPNAVDLPGAADRGERYRADRSPSLNLTDSFQRTEGNPDMEGWLEYRVTKFWHKAYFRLHGHYLSFCRGETQGDVGGLVNLSNVQDMVVDNNEMRLTLNERALMRAGSKSPFKKGDPPVLRLRAQSVEEARQWLDAMRKSALRGTSRNNLDSPGSPLSPMLSIPASPLTSEWKVTELELQHLNGNVIHRVTSLVSNAAQVRVLLGSELHITDMFQVQVVLTGPGGQQVQAVHPLHLDEVSGALDIPVQFPTGGEQCVHLAWQREPTGGEDPGVMAKLQTPQGMVGIAVAVSLLLVSAYLFLIAAVGFCGWWFTGGEKSLELVDCFITYVKVDQEAWPDDNDATIYQRGSSPMLPPSSDRSISSKEMAQLAELRKALEDLQAPNSGVSPAVFDKHVKTDYRLVRFLRARPTVAAAAEMARTSLKWRTEYGADDILQNWKPPEWTMDYFGSPAFLERIRQGRDRVDCYPRDKKGHLTLYWRGGFVNFKHAWPAFHGDMELIRKIFVWLFEFLREDLDLLHEQSNGASPSYLTFVYDLEGFELANQMPIASLLAIAQQMFTMMNINYPELIHRILIVRAPWLFSSFWAMLKPLIPKELLQKLFLTGGGDLKKVVLNITPTVPTDQIPRFLGGTFTDPDGNPECHHMIGPRGPFLPDKGLPCLQAAASNPAS